MFLESVWSLFKLSVSEKSVHFFARSPIIREQSMNDSQLRMLCSYCGYYNCGYFKTYLMSENELVKMSVSNGDSLTNLCFQYSILFPISTGKRWLHDYCIRFNNKRGIFIECFLRHQIWYMCVMSSLLFMCLPSQLMTQLTVNLTITIFIQEVYLFLLNPYIYVVNLRPYTSGWFIICLLVNKVLTEFRLIDIWSVRLGYVMTIHSSVFTRQMVFDQIGWSWDW